MVGIAACARTAPAPPAPEPTTKPVPKTSWVPDGEINPAEYTGGKTYGNYEIYWDSDEEYIYVGMKAKASGFVAVGIKPTLAMKDADMIFGFVKEGEASIYDIFSTGNYGPHPPDTELGGTNDIVEFGGREEGGFTTIEFKRALDTGDDYDKPLTKGVNKIIWAYGSNDSQTLRHSNRGYGEINV